jgi:MtN3 and saliva related transmembrane protein
MNLWTELIGWVASVILIATLLRQVWAQARTRSDVGVSRWLFAGQIAASILFFAYSLLLRNWVFVVSNAMILLTAVAGQIVFYRNRARHRLR